MRSQAAPDQPALAGVKVGSFGPVVAGPLAGTLLADLGAEVVHVEQPGVGDPLRSQGPERNGVPLWWKVCGRNKRSVTLDLGVSAGQKLAHELIAWADVVITNFRYDTLVKWTLDWPSVQKKNPRAVMLQISGNGATSTSPNEPGFGKVGEARSGVVYVTGFPDGPPLHAGFSHGDATTALMGAFAVTAALLRRNEPDFRGEWIDLALYETLFRLIDWQIIVTDQLGAPPERAGNELPIAPAAVVNTYLSSDNVWITVTSGTARFVHNIAALVGDAGDDCTTASDHLARRDRLDRLLRDWIRTRPAEESLRRMAELEVVASRVYSAADIMADPIYQERDDIIRIDDPDLGPVRMQGVIPKLHHYPGVVWRTGPSLGKDNELVYRKWLGKSSAELEGLRAERVI